MAHRSTASPPQYPRQLTRTELESAIARLNKRIEEVRQFDPTLVVDQYNIPHVDKLTAAIDDTLNQLFGAGSHDYTRYKDAARFDNGPHNYLHRVPISQVQQSLARSRARSIALLEQAIESLKERCDLLPQPEVIKFDAPRASSTKERRKVFVVHGHDDGAREAVARFLKDIEFDPIILHEQANQGRTVIEKVEAHSDVGFAVVLLTPDDLGKARDEAQLTPRARQNVLMELGYFIGRLGRNRVCALKRGDVEIPSDFAGVVYELFDGSGGWKLVLGRELKAADFEIDWNKVHG